MVQRFLFVMITLFLSQLVCAAASAQVLFEGYAKVMAGGIHVGFFSRYEYDSKKERISCDNLSEKQTKSVVTSPKA